MTDLRFIVIFQQIDPELRKQVREIHAIFKNPSAKSIETAIIQPSFSKFQTWIEDLMKENGQLTLSYQNLADELQAEKKKVQEEIKAKQALEKIKDDVEAKERELDELGESLNPKELLAARAEAEKQAMIANKILSESNTALLKAHEAKVTEHLEERKTQETRLAIHARNKKILQAEKKNLEVQIAELRKDLNNLEDANRGLFTGQSKLSDEQLKSVEEEQKVLNETLGDLDRQITKVDEALVKSKDFVEACEKMATLKQDQVDDCDPKDENYEEKKGKARSAAKELEDAKKDHKENGDKKIKLRKQHSTVAGNLQKCEDRLKMEPVRHPSNASSTASPTLSRTTTSTSNVSGPSSTTEYSVSGISWRRSSLTCQQCGQPLPPTLKPEPPKPAGPRG
jgi:hypothetical protein